MEDLSPAVLGHRVAELRRRAGVTQEGLALRLHRSASWVKKVEQGRRSLDNARTLLEVAGALGVELGDLRDDLDPSRPGYAAIPALRRALTSSRARVEPRPVDELRTAVIAAGDAWQTEPRCYSEVAPLLPPLIEETRAAADTVTGAQRRAALSVLALACQVGQEVAARLGEPDLAWISARLAADAAAEADDPTLVAVGAWRMSHAALRLGQLDETRDVAADGATTLAPFLRADAGPAGLSAYGALRLVGSVAAARSGDGPDAAALLTDARATAARLGTDTNTAWQTFGPANTGVHETAVALELGHHAEALEAARRVDVRALLTRERRATHHLHVAQALAQGRRDGDALHHVLRAERLEPEGLPHDVLARELVAGLVRRDRRRALAGLRDLARRLRVLDA
jgi:transcriptional regulator with XRE-family HTH domain